MNTDSNTKMSDESKPDDVSPKTETQSSIGEKDNNLTNDNKPEEANPLDDTKAKIKRNNFLFAMLGLIIILLIVFIVVVNIFGYNYQSLSSLFLNTIGISQESTSKINPDSGLSDGVRCSSNENEVIINGEGSYCTPKFISKNNSSNSSSSTSSNLSGSTSSTSDYNLNQKVNFSDGTIISVTGVQRNYLPIHTYTVMGKTYTSESQPDSGKEYVAVTLSIYNGTGKTYDYSPYGMRIQTSDMQQYNSAITLTNETDILGSGYLGIGGTVSGKIIYEIPAGNANLKLVIGTAIIDL